MKAVIQRVSGASVESCGELVGKIDTGLAVLLGVAKGDAPDCAERLASKIAKLRIFGKDSVKTEVGGDSAGKSKLDRSVIDIGGGVLVVSNFTLYANCSHGNRPDFLAAAGAEEALGLYSRFVGALRSAGVEKVECGRFGAQMELKLTCDGPVTIVIDSDSIH